MCCDFATADLSYFPSYCSEVTSIIKKILVVTFITSLANKTLSIPHHQSLSISAHDTESNRGCGMERGWLV